MTSSETRSNRVRKAVATAGVVLGTGLALTAASAPGSGSIKCSTVGSELRVDAGHNALRVERDGDRIAIALAGFARRAEWQGCEQVAASLYETDRVRIVNRRLDHSAVTLDLSEGPFAPGATGEGDGSSEVEFELDLRGLADPFVLRGASTRNAIRLG